MRRNTAASAGSRAARAAGLGLPGNTYRFLHAGSAYAVARRRVWRVVTTLVDRVPSFALEGDLLAGGEAVVDVGGLVAASGHISNEDFLAGVDHFDLTGPVVNASDSVEAQSVSNSAWT